jgi:opacity protein-like surface antigen
MARPLSLLVAVAAVLLTATSAAAQSFGIGPRFSFVRGDTSTLTPDARFIGATMRIATGAHAVFEGTLDYRSYLNWDGSVRTRETPMQGSLLLFITRRVIAPYVGAGIGLYTQTHETLGPGEITISSTSEKRVGWHMGAGTEIQIVPPHVALFVDYRYRFVRFGDPQTANAAPISIPGTTLIPGLQNVKLSHEGSMWTTGMAFYF